MLTDRCRRGFSPGFRWAIENLSVAHLARFHRSFPDPSLTRRAFPEHEAVPADREDNSDSGQDAPEGAKREE